MSNQIDFSQSEKQENNVAVALGSNLGDSLSILENAIQIFSKTPGITLNTYSSWYRTKPIGPEQPDYLNGCALLKVELTPQKLLEIILDIEKQFKRVRLVHWGPRTLDLDLILYDDLILDIPNLQIPHPRMRERAFVLVPLAEIAPDWIDPVSGKAIAQLREEVECSGVSKL
ncbi:MAG: 2-amino-4-hydroxy-6-hydroxymethyldihydropteridine diphosphokinase [Okeania sp. SIO2G4]|uniref:2-amino-4-hydroxy-6- hydroxymethyldihydropteridine diphosphokinase n=1 Tax=unclassified Okeania TaxID=2634635 RepID=UPI0013B60271|nr:MULTISPECIES: 2-amino-4-hydroxy-6-hydroxymethyldihydropteridine diphosphokinase [unclassified Okeania]NEP08536.1 2-amino-4-hydroxy-6-hydroxymethyldihydropteridine diphosphokinase [Okeania sp. SIO4D6]NEP71107.1 2-amino-4-hydroxy-6-hydroxymethyldihydropteridine diphosphokinase [Okeania sp. SIO2G5]NEP97373.1 2-amino-4-hydroxy-6-hydroxymethyldihydropteridine diphosphokinase [Okeania sp. SIO2F5]NEQ90136.1 2-amino-4-hydroxy-6-hydroxymethyldihydropteridine diphosphokinase [Okeania sp. SIO2G4]